MNQNSTNTNNIYNQNEIKNKLQNFQVGKDYFITPTKEGKIKDYTFFNDHLKSLFGGNNWIPVRVWQEKYEDKNVSYRGHFEQGKDYYYSAQHWDYRKGVEKDYQAFRYPKPILNELKRWQEEGFRNIKLYSEGGKLEGGKLKKHWESEENWYKNTENQEVENHRRNLAEFEEKKIQLKNKIEGLSSHIAMEHPIADEKGLAHEKELRGLEQDLVIINDKIRYHEDWLKNYGYNENIQQRGRIGKETESKLVGCCNCGFKEIKFSDNYCQKCGAELCDKAKSGKVDLEKENFELRQQLASVQAELAKVLAELKKLTGKSEALDKLEQQQAQNEKAMKEGSTIQIKEQVAKSQVLAQEASAAKTENMTVPQSENKPKNGVLPYAIVGGSLVAGLGIVAFCWKKRSRK